MKKVVLLIAMVILGVVAFAAPKGAAPKGSASKGAAQKKGQMSLADARNKIGDVVDGKKGVSMKEIMVRLSPDDQKKFLAEVNKAISELPASVEEKTAKYLNLNNEAVRAGKETGTVADLLAETFATVAPESLTVLNERFAIDLLNRATDPNVTYTDEQFTKIATGLMNIINERVEETDNGSARSAFAMLMLIRASNGSPADLSDKLIDTLKHDDAKELARTEWIPAALGQDGHEMGYEPLLASADAGRRPDFAYVLVVAGPQYLDAVLEDISGKNADPISFMRTRSPILDAVENPLRQQLPDVGDGGASTSDIIPPAVDPAAPYPGQTLH